MKLSKKWRGVARRFTLFAHYISTPSQFRNLTLSSFDNSSSNLLIASGYGELRSIALRLVPPDCPPQRRNPTGTARREQDCEHEDSLRAGAGAEERTPDDRGGNAATATYP